MMEGNATEATSAAAEIDELRKHNEKLLAMVNELSTRFAAINFKAYEMAEEIRNLEMRLSGTEASYRCIEWENSQRRQEIRFLRKVLLEIGDPPESIRKLIASYRSEMDARGPEG
jgi:chromosome segregation ATPase